MSTRIFIGVALFVLIFITVGYVLLNEGLLDVQAREDAGRMQVFKASQDGKAIESGASLYEQFCTSCHGDTGEGVPGKGPELNPYLFNTRFPELKALNYPNSLENFIKLTIAAGRPDYSTYWAAKGELYAAPMQTWSLQFGGPMRNDMIDDITAYMMSWQASAGESTVVVFDSIGNNLTAELPAGDAARGQQLWDKDVNLASGKPAPCSACHSLNPGETLVGPSLAGIGSRAATTVAGQDAATYMRHSIQAPSEHIVEGASFAVGEQSLMPANLGNDMSAQDLADLVAYLLSLQ